MILVTIGVMYGFERLIAKMDEIALTLNEPIVMQIGETKYEPKHSKYFRYTSRDKMEELYSQVRVIVGHAGVGTVLKALEYKKPLILVPRLKKYNEHINDHQLEIAKELEKEGIGKIVYDVEELESALKAVSQSNGYFANQGKNSLVDNLSKYLDQIVPNKKFN
jgi:beta-1,4-N-acetylglucosaminyltransferase